MSTLSNRYDFRTRLTPGDMMVRSYAYDRRRQRLEIFYRWKSGSQYHPITPAMFQYVTAAEQINPLLDEWIKQRRITWEEVPDGKKDPGDDGVLRPARR